MKKGSRYQGIEERRKTVIEWAWIQVYESVFVCLVRYF